MTQDPLFYVVAAAMIGVLLILMFGIGAFAKGGAFNRKYANRAMRWRLGAQFFAVMLILLFVWLRGGS